MIKFTLIVLTLTVISTSCLQEIPNTAADQSLTNDPSSPLWYLQNYPIQRRKGKPCPRRNSRRNEPWIPSYSSKITHPLYEPVVLEPQALKNEESQNNLLPKDESETEQPNRRSLSVTVYPVQPFNSNDLDDDCEEQFDSTKGDPEETALKIIEDCLKKKQKSKIEETLLGSSRRSMPNSADENEDTEGGPLFSNIPVPTSAGRQENKDENSSRRKLDSPTETTKSADLETTSGNIAPSLRKSLDKMRKCYACTTATNPSCWNPDNRTTIKYCTQEESCVTKTFGVKNSRTLIRDCANSCKDSSIPGLEPKYKSCQLCHSDYCNSVSINGSISINGYNFAIILIIAIAKFTHYVL